MVHVCIGRAWLAGPPSPIERSNSRSVEGIYQSNNEHAARAREHLTAATDQQRDGSHAAIRVNCQKHITRARICI